MFQEVNQTPLLISISLRVGEKQLEGFFQYLQRANLHSSDVINKLHLTSENNTQTFPFHSTAETRGVVGRRTGNTLLENANSRNNHKIQRSVLSKADFLFSPNALASGGHLASPRSLSPIPEALPRSGAVPDDPLNRNNIRLIQAFFVLTVSTSIIFDLIEYSPDLSLSPRMQTTLGIFIILFLKHVQGGTLRPSQEAQSRPMPIYLACCFEPMLAFSFSLKIKGENIQEQLWFLMFANLSAPESGVVDPQLASKKRGIQESFSPHEPHLFRPGLYFRI